MVIVVYCCCSVEENLWPTGSPIAKPATSANGSNCLYKLTPVEVVCVCGAVAEKKGLHVWVEVGEEDGMQG